MKKSFLIFFVAFFLFSISFFIGNNFFVNRSILVFGEDDEKEDDEEHEEDEEDEEDGEDKEDDDEVEIKTITTTEYPNPRVEVKKNIQTVTLNDSDGDGLIDDEDPHPNVPEIYIVKDDNLNGIVDKYENEN